MPNIKRIFDFEWEAQILQNQLKVKGAQIIPLIQISQVNLSTEKLEIMPNPLIMQGSFDPPTLSHIKLLMDAIKLHKNAFPSNFVDLFILLSISHVDKSLNVTNHSLLGYRIEMLEALFQDLLLPIRIRIGFSNVARYIDLIEACEVSLKVSNPSFIMGMDVFKKVLESSYYSEPLEEILPLIFRAIYYVGGRGNIFSENEFSQFLSHHTFLLKKYMKRIIFVPMSEKFRNQNATQIRKNYANNVLNQKIQTHRAISKYLSNYNIYSQSSENLSLSISIQTLVRLAIKTEVNKQSTYAILNDILTQIKEKKSVQKKIIKEYDKGKNEELYKKWKRLIN